jgi:hypothetical protein
MEQPMLEELKKFEELNSHYDIKKRDYDNAWCVWAPYYNEDLAIRWQVVSVHESKGKAEKFIKSKSESKQVANKSV